MGFGLGDAKLAVEEIFGLISEIIHKKGVKLLCFVVFVNIVALIFLVKLVS